MSDFASATKSQGARGSDVLAAHGELVAALARTLDRWLREALSDEEILAGLAERLGPHLPLERSPRASSAGGATAEDLQAVVEALLLLEARVERVESAVAGLSADGSRRESGGRSEPRGQRRGKPRAPRGKKSGEKR